VWQSHLPARRPFDVWDGACIEYGVLGHLNGGGWFRQAGWLLNGVKRAGRGLRV